jgi:hypothetical protein
VVSVRTKPCEGVLRVDVGDLDRRPELFLLYDGLAGITQRPIIRDLMDEVERQGPEVMAKFLATLRRYRAGYVVVHFSDYVSYGIGGGDATAEFYFGRYLLLHEPARPQTETQPAVPEHLALYRPSGTERLALQQPGILGDGAA